MLEQIHRTYFTVYDMNSMMSGILHESRLTLFFMEGKQRFCDINTAIH